MWIKFLLCFLKPVFIPEEKLKQIQSVINGTVAETVVKEDTGEEILM